MPTIEVRSRCLPAKSAILCRRRPCSACGNGAPAKASAPRQVQSTFDFVMRKAALLYNPDSGGSGKRRQRELESALAVLRNGGVEAGLLLTESRDHAAEEARVAIASGCDTIFACGGDGTINKIAQ